MRVMGVLVGVVGVLVLLIFLRLLKDLASMRTGGVLIGMGVLR